MLYSLPNGKVIELSVEQYLELTDEELEYLISINYGDPIENPFFGSVLNKPAIVDEIVEFISSPNCNFIIEELDDSIDYIPEEE